MNFCQEALLNKLKTIRVEDKDAELPSPEQYHVLRALGTCSTAKGADVVVETVLWNPRIDPTFPDELLRVLLLREVLHPDRLMTLAESSDTHEFARNFFVEGLGEFPAVGMRRIGLRKAARDARCLSQRC